MKNFIIVKVKISDKTKANNMLNILLNKGLIAGGSVTRVLSKYYSRGKVLMHEDYELTLDTLEEKYERICRVIENTYNNDNFKVFSMKVDNYNYYYSRYMDEIR